MAKTSKGATAQGMGFRNGLPEKSEYAVGSNTDFNKRMGNIWLELLKKAALYAAVMGLLAGIAAALFFRS